MVLRRLFLKIQRSSLDTDAFFVFSLCFQESGADFAHESLAKLWVFLGNNQQN